MNTIFIKLTTNLLTKITVKILLLIASLFSSASLAWVDLVMVDKSDNKMYLLSSGKVIKEYHVALGKNPEGHKEQEGDKRTPEGFYTLDYKKEDSAFYRAMHISYPNQFDLDNAEQKGVSAGGLIMIHGQRNNFEGLARYTQKSNWTNGCIALTNPEIDEFMALVEVGTQIHIKW
ncbi:L,D-transpeptidase family protein [Colwellia echini]|uniref:L,D-transpeptidase family protein n=1 Tax=Colwellia echini TaxID=1982103 RepID=A0ABY3MSR8_9GAMM|nr:L,D-transpeptidase family protein [Colwellia echini]TYK64229.1 L,D-transpeptidase family protein [Colwellia echini]